MKYIARRDIKAGEEVSTEDLGEEIPIQLAVIEVTPIGQSTEFPEALVTFRACITQGLARRLSMASPSRAKLIVPCEPEGGR